jgi:glutamate N-acetyltransferase/amino-acid N-acetyltransferase
MSNRPAASDIPRGYSFAATACGLKKSGLDLALLISETPAAAAALFTTNRVQAAPVLVSKAHLRQARHRMRGVIVNSGNANCCTGARGTAATIATALAAARELGCAPSQFLVCSTGVIGVPLRVEKILRAVPRLVRTRRAGAGAFVQLTRAIMTTDTRPKWAAARFRIGGKTVRLLGCAKGAGMIHPRLATMLAFVVTDAAIAPALLARALRDAARRTFNAITVDSDTSTNDTLALLANGASGAPRIGAGTARFRKFCALLEAMCRKLALAIVADGEGARRVVEIEVCCAPSDRAADQVARTVANSPLVKTALSGADPNWAASSLRWAAPACPSTPRAWRFVSPASRFAVAVPRLPSMSAPRTAACSPNSPLSSSIWDFARLVALPIVRPKPRVMAASARLVAAAPASGLATSPAITSASTPATAAKRSSTISAAQTTAAWRELQPQFGAVHK